MAAPWVRNVLSNTVPKISCGCGYNIVKYIPGQFSRLLLPVRANILALHLSSTAVKNETPATRSTASKKGQKISQAMKAYLEQARAHDKVMSAEIAEYELGKRHLANMMGKDVDSFTQEDIDAAIEYLLPSSLHEKRARPQLQHPTKAFPLSKAAQFGPDGRPFHPLFYTALPTYYQYMYDAGVILDKLKRLQDLYDNPAEEAAETETHLQDILTEATVEIKPVFLAGSKWITFKEFKEVLQEKVTEDDFKRFIVLLERIAEQPNSILEEDFIFKFRHVLTRRSLAESVRPKLIDDAGRDYQISQGRRKTARAEVKVYRNGTGQFTVNGKTTLEHFPRIMDREQLLFPLQFTGLLGEVDVISTVVDGGCSSQAGAIRHALADALQTFVDIPTLEKMRLIGLLTIDPRVRERKKPGQFKARKKHTWKRR